MTTRADGLPQRSSTHRRTCSVLKPAHGEAKGLSLPDECIPRLEGKFYGSDMVSLLVECNHIHRKQLKYLCLSAIPCTHLSAKQCMIRVTERSSLEVQIGIWSDSTPLFSFVCDHSTQCTPNHITAFLTLIGRYKNGAEINAWLCVSTRESRRALR
ncbi:hypothetical protein HYPSUDRAFT_40125 [Hypholoma sublateritium FD-334 SS-4]|uniref:Uncharacterized protein n=1 Tax=Hypholoma sublateritium (strain FD-334 SS-4) TaxID=945553 RepID=A0A0D2NWX6_HYPSF|nr:hypothetical protein HYPSUDRAFT_40125 [Hypholoma sublateritium FD-334 SS-4]